MYIYINIIHWNIDENWNLRLNSLRPSDAYMGQWSNQRSDNGLSPGRRQAITRTNAGLLLTESLGTNFGEI